MSLIATAFYLNVEQLKRVRAFADAGSWEKLWKFLATTGPDLFASFGYSGLVFLTLLEYYESREVEFPWAGSGDGQIIGFDLTHAILKPAERVNLMRQIRSLSPTKAELQNYFEEFNGEKWIEAGDAMESAQDLLLHALGTSQNADDMLFFEIG